MKVIPCELLSLVYHLEVMEYSSSPFGCFLQVPKRKEGSMATTQLALSIAFMATVSLLIKLMLVTLQSCGRAMFRPVAWLGFDVVAKSIFPLSLNTDLVY